MALGEEGRGWHCRRQEPYPPPAPPPRPRRDGGEEQEGPGTGEQNKAPSSKRPRVFLGGAQQTAKPGKALGRQGGAGVGKVAPGCSAASEGSFLGHLLVPLVL